MLWVVRQKPATSLVFDVWCANILHLFRRRIDRWTVRASVTQLNRPIDRRTRT